MKSKRDKDLESVRDDVVACKKCPLYKGRTFPVVGQGSHRAKIMFIGEAPGKREDLTGTPFCGRSGMVLDELLASVGIKREDVYIANVLKCRPPMNRDPEEKEIKACSGYLERQIEAIKPSVVCPLGRYSMRFVMERFGFGEKIEPISRIHGQLFRSDSVAVVPFYHPAVAVYNPNMKGALKEDFKILKKYAD